MLAIMALISFIYMYKPSFTEQPKVSISLEIDPEAFDELNIPPILHQSWKTDDLPAVSYALV